MEHFVFFVFTFLFSFLINGLFLKFAGTLGAKNSPEQHPVIRWGSTSKPAFGGISFYIIFLASYAVYSTFYSDENDTSPYLGILVASSLGFLIGLADDAYNTKPVLKFVGQVCCGLILIYSGMHIDLFESVWANYLLTLLWVVGMMNSINMLDNMDAITTVVSIGAVLCVLVTLMILGDYTHFYLWLMLGVLASLLGFLYYNWNPSKMYMGDTGSQFLGVLLAAVGIFFFWNDHGNSERSEWVQAIAPLLVFLPSIVDTTVVVINRLAKGTSPFIGGKDHTTHHLSYLGLSDRQVALVFLMLSLLSVSLSLTLLHFDKQYQQIILYFSIGYCAVVFLLLFWVSRKKKSIKRAN